MLGDRISLSDLVHAADPKGFSSAETRQKVCAAAFPAEPSPDKADIHCPELLPRAALGMRGCAQPPPPTGAQSSSTGTLPLAQAPLSPCILREHLVYLFQLFTHTLFYCYYYSPSPLANRDGERGGTAALGRLRAPGLRGLRSLRSVTAQCPAAPRPPAPPGPPRPFWGWGAAGWKHGRLGGLKGQNYEGGTPGTLR